MARKQPKTTDNPWDEAYIESLAWHEDYVKEARKVLKKRGFGKVESRADGLGWWTKVKGMSGTYQVSVRPDEKYGFVSECSCPSNKRPCKHALALLLYLAAHPEKRIEPAPSSSIQSSDLDALVRAVFANPQEDTPRLILADCAEELGQSARAAFIRLQCEKARIEEKGKRFQEIAQQVKKLMPQVREEMGSIPDTMSATFDRGFVKLTAQYGWWGLALDSLPAKFPELFRDGWIEVVSIPTVYSLQSWVIGLLRQVREVDFSRADLSDRELIQIASELQPGRDGARLQSVLVPARYRKRYSELASLAAQGAAPGEETKTGLVRRHYYGGSETDSPSRIYLDLNPTQFSLLAHGGHFRNAQSLSLTGEIGDAGIDTLVATPGLNRLTQLQLNNSRIGPAGIAVLASSPLANRLTELFVNNSPLGDESATAFGGGKWSRLTHLSLDAAGLTDGCAAGLVRCDIPALSRLSLCGNAFTDAGAKVLLQAKQLQNVSHWELSDNPIPISQWFTLVLSSPRSEVAVSLTKAAAELRTNKSGELHLGLTGSNVAEPELFDHWAKCSRSVVSLTLAKLRFDTTGFTRVIAALVASPVRELHVTGSQLRNEAVTVLATKLADLKLDVLDLSHNAIGKAGGEALAASPGLKSVHTLLLGGNPIRPAGVDALVASKYLKSLKRLTLPAQDIPPNRKKEIRAELGKGVAVEFE
jgi:uncharacterized protein (TIGR02996 family)